MYDLILASQSPRRLQLLRDSGYNPIVHPVKVSEIIKENLNLPEAILDLARQKLDGFLEQYKSLDLREKIVLTSDTMVVHEQKALGKPTSEQHAFEILAGLSGSQHQVLTSVLLYNGDSKEICGFVESTAVQFKPLTTEEIWDYIKTGEPMDKAGAYGIQGQGKKFVHSYIGSWSNVVGLPVEELSEFFRKAKWPVKVKPL